jgi:prophage antirepressor-like protein
MASKFAQEAGLTFDIRVVTLDGNPWFVAADVCRALGLDDSTHKHMAKLSEGEKTRKPVPGMRGAAAFLIAENGLYKLVMRSDKPQARKFQDWVTREVLPAIRKDGAYVMGEVKVRTGEMSEDELLVKAFGILQAKAARLAVEKAGLVGLTPPVAPRPSDIQCDPCGLLPECRQRWARPQHP